MHSSQKRWPHCVVTIELDSAKRLKQTGHLPWLNWWSLSLGGLGKFLLKWHMSCCESGEDTLVLLSRLCSPLKASGTHALLLRDIVSI